MSSKSSGKKKPQKKPASNSKGFGIGIGEAFLAGLRGYFSNAIIMTIAGLPVLIVFAVLSIPAVDFQGDLQDMVDSGEINSISVLDSLKWVGLLMMAAVPAGILSAPWFRYALDIVDQRDINIKTPLFDTQKLLHHALATFWLWAGIGFGLRYLRGIPSVLVILLYAFYGYVIADGKDINGLKALGTSVRLGHGKKIGLFAIAGLFFIFNLVGALGLGVGLEDGSPSLVGLILGVLGLSATASVTLISGAAIYRALEADLD